MPIGFSCPVCGQGEECGASSVVDGVRFCAECVKDSWCGGEPELTALMLTAIAKERARREAHSLWVYAQGGGIRD